MTTTTATPTNLTPTEDEVDKALLEAMVLEDGDDVCHDGWCPCLVLDDGDAIQLILCPTCGTQWTRTPDGWGTTITMTGIDDFGVLAPSKEQVVTQYNRALDEAGEETVPTAQVEAQCVSENGCAVLAFDESDTDSDEPEVRDIRCPFCGTGWSWGSSGWVKDGTTTQVNRYLTVSVLLDGEMVANLEDALGALEVPDSFREVILRAAMREGLRSVAEAVNQGANEADIQVTADNITAPDVDVDVDASGFEVAAATDRYPGIAFTASDMDDAS